MSNADPVAIARDLLRCPSVTPAEGGALDYLEALFKKAGFTTHRVTLAEDGYSPIDNLYARIGTSAPHLTFAGHTDVVPPGDETAWTHPPFGGEIVDGVLYGRGAVDMKGGIACAAAAALDYLNALGGKPKGSISFLITGDEESVAVNGTVKLLPWVAAKGEKFDHCILAEPSNREALGDTVKIGRRGSLNGALTVHGKQCHVAYPDRGENPVTGIVTLIAAIKAEPLDSGSAHFSPSNLEFTSVDVGNPTTNVIPSQAIAKFNIRFNDCHSVESLKTLVEKRALKAAAGHIRFTFDWKPTNANVFLVAPSLFTEKVTSAIEEATGRKPELSTSGGTSDARFIKDYCPVVEFGLVGQTMHQIDERVPTQELVTLTAIFRKILDRYFG